MDEFIYDLTLEWVKSNGILKNKTLSTMDKALAEIKCVNHYIRDFVESDKYTHCEECEEFK